MLLKAIQILIIIFGISILTFNSIEVKAEKDPARYVNTFIGTGGHGHTYPGATAPFGMVQLSPDTRLEGWDGCGGYHYTDSLIYGFSHTHLSGTGVPDLADILVIPITGQCIWNNGYDGKQGYRSEFRHQTEKSEPGYYKVHLDKYNVDAELTATTRTGFHQYTFNEAGDVYILFDLVHRDEVLTSSIRVVNDHQIEGLRKSSYWADRQYVYFSATFSKPFISYEINDNGRLTSDLNEVKDSKSLKSAFKFNVVKGEKILVKVGISAVSEDGARLNREQEIPGWDFNAVRRATYEMWNDELSGIEVEGGTKDMKSIFYTALYHTMVVPNVFHDVDGQYRGMDGGIHNTDRFVNYSVFSLWDTYRAYHPLMTLIDQKRTGDWINTFLNMYSLGGLLPVWELNANETWCMIGYHSIPVIVDAYMKGIRNFDKNLALEAMLKSAYRDNKGLSAMQELGFIPSDTESESVSKTLEYAYDDWCIAQYAKSLGKDDVYINFIRRAQSYKNLFNPETGFMRAKLNNGWYSPFDPAEVNYNFTEANSWQYSFSVTHDLDGLSALLGGKDKLASKLDALFTASSQTTGREQSDITGLIGQYAHGNEPSHHIAYLYPYVSQPWKTQQRVHQIMTDFYRNNPDGLIGNEDCGQMSAWAVLSALGFYQVNPGSDHYVIGTPWFKKSVIHLENGKTFTIEAGNVSDRNFYIKSAKLNAVDYNRSFLKYEDIMNGGTISFVMDEKPNTQFGTGTNNEPVTSINDHEIVICPVLKDAVAVFTKSKIISFESIDKNTNIYYYFNDGTVTEINPIQYIQPFEIAKTTDLYFYSVNSSGKSAVCKSHFIQAKNDLKCTLSSAPSSQYSGNGSQTLVDGLFGNEDFRLGGWLGYEGTDLDVIVDLGNETSIHSLSAHCMQDINAWIFMPLKITFSLSGDGINFEEVGNVDNRTPNDRAGNITDNFLLSIDPKNARYIKVSYKSIGICPPGHKGNGGKAWFFTDEISVNK